MIQSRGASLWKSDQLELSRKAVICLGPLRFSEHAHQSVAGVARRLALDGGRVLRSILWKTSGSITAATRRAATAGGVVASVLIGLGIFVVFAGDLSGLWMAAIGWFLFQAASATGSDAVLRQMLKAVKASDLMSQNLVTIPSDVTIREAVEE